MIHAKIAVVDGKWAVVGSTNLDSRSFGLNNEVDLGMPDSAVAARLEEDLKRDLGRSRQVRFEEWKRRPWWEKMQEWGGWLIRSQQ